MGELKKYNATLITLVIISISIAALTNMLMSNLSSAFYILINVVFIVFIGLIIFSTLITYNILNNKDVSKLFMDINFYIINFIFPLIILSSKLIKVGKNDIRKVYVELNNKRIYKSKYNISPNDIMILLPHCVQKNSCKLRVTTNIENCKKCMLCDIGSLLELQESKGVSVFIATGGTLARKIILDKKPKAIIAVACERDLTSGVQDINKIPVLGVFNKRPNGPCVDTLVDIDEVNNAIKYFIGEC